ncbi:hypothetical protein [Ideonella livida]|uniref:Uncharacterized protein n=1 Tax=Ideonella livida TaxID=2707176 RepID=A0A7C9PJD5_9BURK|nr:hypothetical protein [Ideonella livida]NDY93456.1 hypothetical protein [Ideonella livida]
MSATRGALPAPSTAPCRPSPAWGRPAAALALGLAVGLQAPAARAEARLAAPGQGASARLDFRIIIPPVIRLLENRHAAELQADGQGRLRGEQTLVVLSNLKRGFCVTLRRHLPEGIVPPAWHLEDEGLGGLSAEPTAEGWRLCAARPGRYTLQLRHAFEPPPGQPAPAAQAWPVWADVAAL